MDLKVISDKNPSLLNVTYIRPNKKLGIPESFEVIYVDDNGNVQKSNEEALVDIWFVKPELRTFNYHKPQEKMENMFSKKVLVSDIKYEIAKEIGPGGEAFVQDCFRNNDYRSLDKLYGWRYCFGCDFQPEFYYMREWYKKYKLNNIKLKKAFIDIETDLIDYVPDMDRLYDTAYAPVNCITVVFDWTREVYTFILNPYEPQSLVKDEEYKKRYALYENQLKQHQDLVKNKDKFIQESHEAFDAMYGSMDYKPRFYDEEIEMITDVFRLINDRKPYFCLAWNMRFDLQYLYERIKVLGYQPTSIICHPDFDHPVCFFKIDKMMYQIPKQNDYFRVSSYTQYICQLRLYASIRKSEHVKKSYKLNVVADEELGDKKIEYPDETNIMMFPYKDWKLFIRYNQKDQYNGSL